jgi:hypothetical protein
MNNCENKKRQPQTLFFTLCAHKNEGHAEVGDKQSDLNHNNEAKKIDKKTQKSRFPTCLSAETPQLSTTVHGALE